MSSAQQTPAGDRASNAQVLRLWIQWNNYFAAEWQTKIRCPSGNIASESRIVGIISFRKILKLWWHLTGLAANVQFYQCQDKIPQHPKENSAINIIYKVFIIIIFSNNINNNSVVFTALLQENRGKHWLGNKNNWESVFLFELSIIVADESNEIRIV